MYDTVEMETTERVTALNQQTDERWLTGLGLAAIYPPADA